MSHDYCSIAFFEVSLVVPLQLLCLVCILQTRPLFELAVLFNTCNVQPNLSNFQPLFFMAKFFAEYVVLT